MVHAERLRRTKELLCAEGLSKGADHGKLGLSMSNLARICTLGLAHYGTSFI